MLDSYADQDTVSAEIESWIKYSRISHVKRDVRAIANMADAVIVDFIKSLVVSKKMSARCLPS